MISSDCSVATNFANGGGRAELTPLYPAATGLISPGTGHPSPSTFALKPFISDTLVHTTWRTPESIQFQEPKRKTLDSAVETMLVI